MVGIIMGSSSDLPVMQDAIQVCKDFGSPLMTAPVKLSGADPIQLQNIFDSGLVFFLNETRALHKHQALKSVLHFYLSTQNKIQ